MKWVPYFVTLLLVRCVQSTAIVDPVTNKAYTASTAPTQGTLTLDITLTTQGTNHEGQPFSAVLFQNGVLKAAQYNNGSTNGVNRTGTTGGGNAGKATLVLGAVDANGCPTGTPATLANGVYSLYFAIEYSGNTAQAINTGTAGTSCNATKGFIRTFSGVVAPAAQPSQLYAYRGNVTINGNTTLSIGNGSVFNGYQHTFQFTTGGAWNYACYVTDSGVSSYSTATQLLGLFTLAIAGNGSTTGTGGTTNLMAAGLYKYFCYADANNNASYFESGLDKLATGTLVVTGFPTGVSGYSTTYLNAANFTTLP